MTSRLRPGRDERGNAVIELVWLGLLLLVPLIWIVLSVFEVQRGAFGVSAAARSAGRAFALAPDDTTGLHRARAAAEVALGDQGVHRAWTLSVTCPPRPDCHTGGAVVVVRVKSSVSLPFLPKALGDDATFALAAEHTVPIGQYQETGP